MLGRSGGVGRREGESMSIASGSIESKVFGAKYLMMKCLKRVRKGDVTALTR